MLCLCAMCAVKYTNNNRGVTNVVRLLCAFRLLSLMALMSPPCAGPQQHCKQSASFSLIFA